MKRQVYGLGLIGLLAVLIALVAPLEAQPPVCSSGGALMPGCVIPIQGITLGATPTASNPATTKLLYNTVVPRIASGFGTTPTISSNNGNATFRVNVGTGGTASTGVLTMPQAATGWNCVVTHTAVVAGSALTTLATATTTTTVTLGAVLDNGVAGAWASGATLIVSCGAY